MEPHSYECGNKCFFLPGTSRHCCFNGAALLRVRKYDDVDDIKEIDPCFNGAALLRVRKFEVVAVTALHDKASMEPHSYECGNLQGHRLFLYRTFCFNGAALLRVRKSIAVDAVKTLFLKLQWSRTLTSAEMRRSRRPTPTPKRASMEPHSYECGNSTSP